MKKPYAFVIVLMSAAAIGLIAASLGTNEWVSITIKRDSGASPCTVKRTFGFFSGDDIDDSGLCGGDNEFKPLSDPSLEASQELLYVEIVLCALTIVCGFAIFVVGCYNLISRPYESWAGPVALLSYFGSGVILNLVLVIAFVVYGFVDLIDTVPKECDSFSICKDQGFVQESFYFGYSFYLVVASLAPFIIGMVVVLVAGKSLTKRIKSKLCPSALDEPEIEDGKDNNIMMF